VQVCALSSLRCAVTCNELLNFATSNCFPYAAGRTRPHSAPQQPVTRASRLRVAASVGSPQARAGRFLAAAQLVALLQIEQPSQPLPALACRYAFYLQVSALCDYDDDYGELDGCGHRHGHGINKNCSYFVSIFRH
jgi:hypothetical protein